MIGSKKNLLKSLGKNERLQIVSKDEKVTVEKQCKILEINRTSFYYIPSQKDREKEYYIKNRIDYWHTKMCYAGARKLKKLLEKEGIYISRKLINRYMNEMGIYCIYPKPNLSKNSKQHKRFPYLLRGLTIDKINQVWAIDITYIPMGKSHMYLTAIIDWYSRYLVGWELSDTLETAPVIKAVNDAIAKYGKPTIINSDQGSQFTSDEYIKNLEEKVIIQSMDGKARWVDNVIIERWFRSLKCDNIYINGYETPRELRLGINEYITDYNTIRPHQSLEYATPEEIYYLKKVS